ncbi:ATP synthase subunit f, mitochondrial-like [Prionailurus viverrinus]|uniref:ATP synthase subunit f, mitochondrial-like n=1 Tax=Prionailurus viverrinus TaxID=61388 RepID=UPI001FF5993A|nr:ATP synthase subunit f, mitochondrial-like [Prionailurus viverrinus]
MASSLPVKETKLTDVKLGELPSWILMRDFTPKAITGEIQRGYYRYYKYLYARELGKGGIAGISMVLAAYGLFNYYSYKELKHEQLCKYH